MASAQVDGFEFSRDLLALGTGSRVDVSRFSRGNPQLAGVYRADVFVNDRWLMRRDIRLAGNPAIPCIDSDLLQLLRLRPESMLPSSAAPQSGQPAIASGDSGCQPIEQFTRGVSVRFDSGEQRLDFYVAQASQARQPRGYVPPESLDRGINASVLDYTLNGFRTDNEGVRVVTAFAGLSARVNYGDWRLRKRINYNLTPSGHWQHDDLGTSLSTDIPAWRSALSIGDAYTGGQLFSSVRMRGVSLAADSRMLPESQRGFAPVIRGVAVGNAKVEILQNNVVVYSTTVPPGPFEINDLYPTGYGGELKIVVTEANGKQTVTTMPFSVLPQLLREGVFDYAVDVGQVLGYARTRKLLQGTALYGLNNTLTLAGGVLASDDYAAVLLGSAWNTPIGAFQVNGIQASFKRNSLQRYKGWTVETSWAESIAPTRTHFSFIAYRYSSRGFYSLEEGLRQQDTDEAAITMAPSRARNRMVLSVSQMVGQSTSFFIAANTASFWDSTNKQFSYQAGVSQQWGPVQLSLSAGRSRTLGSANTQNTYSLAMSIPLSTGPESRTGAVASYTHASSTGDTRQVGLSGAYGSRGQFSYGLNQLNSQSNGNTLSVNAGYQARTATVGVTALTSRGISQQSLTLSGGIVAADGHVVFAPFVGDTMGLVHVADAKGMNLATSEAVQLNDDGYALMPYLTPYASNSVELDVSRAPLSARFDSTSAMVAPRAGAIVLRRFKRLPGYTLMLQGRRADGKPLPFGASVYDASGMQVGNVGQVGRIEVPSRELAGRLRVAWGGEAQDQCLIRYDLPNPTGGDDALVLAGVTCEPASASSPRDLAQAPPGADAQPVLAQKGTTACQVAACSHSEKKP